MWKDVSAGGAPGSGKLGRENSVRREMQLEVLTAALSMVVGIRSSKAKTAPPQGCFPDVTHRATVGGFRLEHAEGITV